MTSGSADDGSGETVRHTLVGLAVGGVVFLGLGLYLNLTTGFAPVDHAGPLALLALVGATVGGLVGPLLGALARRWRSRQSG